jgi:bifunctional non-homologous end joining protein LigD
MAAAFASLPARMAQIDGELCLCDADGWPDFRALMRAARQRPAEETRLSFHAFDAADLKPKSLAERRRRLVELVHGLDEAVPVLFLPDAFASGDELLAMCAKMRLEGTVSKRLDRPNVSGPTRDWIKVKCAAWKEANRWRAEVFEKTR